MYFLRTFSLLESKYKHSNPRHSSNLYNDKMTSLYHKYNKNFIKGYRPNERQIIKCIVDTQTQKI